MFEWFKKLDKEDSKPKPEFEVDPVSGMQKSIQITIGYQPRTKMYFITLINRATGEFQTAALNLEMFVKLRNSLTNTIIKFEGGFDVQ